MVWVAGPGRPKGVFLRPLGVFPSPLVDPVHPQKAPFSLPDCFQGFGASRPSVAVWVFRPFRAHNTANCILPRFYKAWQYGFSGHLGPTTPEIAYCHASTKRGSMAFQAI